MAGMLSLRRTAEHYLARGQGRADVWPKSCNSSLMLIGLMTVIAMRPVVTTVGMESTPVVSRVAVRAAVCLCEDEANEGVPSAGELNEISPASLAAELQKRGLQTALDQLAEDGPSAFKDAHKIIEYIMLLLQADPDKGVEEAFRFTARQPGTSSFVSGLPLSSKRVSWLASRYIGGYVSSARYIDKEIFAEEFSANFSWLRGCATWRWAVVSPSTYAPIYRDAERDFLREYVVIVDDRPVAFQLFYDWGAWCYLIYKVVFLDDDAATMHELGDRASASDEGWEGKSSRSRGGSL